MNATTVLQSPSVIAINSVIQSTDSSPRHKKNSSGQLLDTIGSSVQKPILVSKAELLEQILQRSHASSFASDDQQN